MIHTAKPYSLSDFGKSIGARCTTDIIEHMDSQGQLQVIDCFFKRGPNNGLSKGLLEISKELNVKLPPKIKLEQLREILANHPAFKVVSLINYVTCLLFTLLLKHLVLNNLLISITLRCTFDQSFIANLTL